MRLRIYTTLMCGAIVCACAGDPTTPDTDLVDRPSLGRAPASPANPELVYGGNSGGVQYLWVANADGSHAAAIVQLPDFWKPFPSWAPGGDGTLAAPYRIAFSNGSCHLERVDVTIDPATRRPVVSDRIDLDAKFDTPAQSCDPDWSPVGDRIAFVNLTPDANGISSLWAVDELGATPPVRLYDAPAGFLPKWPCWSPDGSEIAFLEIDRTYPYPTSIKVLTLATRAVRTVLAPGVPNLAMLDWARKSNALLITAGTGANGSGNSYEVWRLDLGTPQMTKVTLGWGATWSPNDDRFAFVSWTSGKLSIYNFATKTTTSLGLAATWPEWRRR
jgi:hypothetical protein